MLIPKNSAHRELSNGRSAKSVRLRVQKLCWKNHFLCLALKAQKGRPCLLCGPITSGRIDFLTQSRAIPDKRGFQLSIKLKKKVHLRKKNKPPHLVIFGGRTHIYIYGRIRAKTTKSALFWYVVELDETNKKLYGSRGLRRRFRAPGPFEGKRCR